MGTHTYTLDDDQEIAVAWAATGAGVSPDDFVQAKVNTAATTAGRGYRAEQQHQADAAALAEKILAADPDTIAKINAMLLAAAPADATAEAAVAVSQPAG